MTYEYKCRVCKHEFEAEQRITDEPLYECPRCLTAALERLICGGQGFQLKGDCWAKDSYAKPKKE